MYNSGKARLRKTAHLHHFVRPILCAVVGFSACKRKDLRQSSVFPCNQAASPTLNAVTQRIAMNDEAAASFNLAVGAPPVREG